MKKMLIAALAVLSLFALPARADSDFGVKMGALMAENDSAAAIQAGLVYSWDFAGMVGAEAELNTSVSEGEFGPFDYKATQLGGYAVLMSPGPVYVKGKAGMVYTNADVAGASDSDTDIAYGIGVGFFGFELEITQSGVNNTDLTFVSLSFKF